MTLVKIVAPALLAAAALLPGRAARTAPASPSPSAQGAWNAAPLDGDRLLVTFIYAGSIWGRGISRAELRGLPAAGSAGPVTLRLEREAGVFRLEGAFHGERGEGRFTFERAPAFVQALRAAGVTGELSDRDLMLLALGRVTADGVRGLADAGLGRLSAHDLVQLAGQGITAEYIRSLRALGVQGTGTAAGLVELRTHRITAEYVQELRALGYGGVTRAQLLQMGIHGVTTDFIRQARAAGLRDLSPEALVQRRLSGAALPASRQP